MSRIVALRCIPWQSSPDLTTFFNTARLYSHRKLGQEYTLARSVDSLVRQKARRIYFWQRRQPDPPQNRMYYVRCAMHYVSCTIYFLYVLFTMYYVLVRHNSGWFQRFGEFHCACERASTRARVPRTLKDVNDSSASRSSSLGAGPDMAGGP